MDHDVDRGVVRQRVPGEDHRAAGHRLAGEIVLPLVHHAVLVDLAPAHAKVAGIDDDPVPAGIPVEAELEDRQARLRGDREAHDVGDLQLMGADEIFLGEEKQRELAELRRARQKRERARRALPERVVDAVLGEHAAAAPFGEPAHGP